MSLKIAIVGRPNVGKSTLFNRLVGKRVALVDDRPGVTRDRRYGEGELLDRRFTIIDTAGLEEADPGSLQAGMRAQTDRAVADADVILFLIDARAGVTPLDRFFADWLRTLPKPILLVANKAEGRAGEAGLIEAYELGLGEPLALSAAHGDGTPDLAEALEPFWRKAQAKAKADAKAGNGPASATMLAPPDVDVPLPEDDPDQTEEEAEDPEPWRPDRPLQLAIVGRPNVGKSTLVNALLGEERMLTGPEPGVTRDAISNEWLYDGRAIRLVDTAGLRRKARIEEKIEQLSVGNTLGTIRMAECVVLVLDANAILDKQDLTIARHVAEEGRALIIAVNKWDAADDRKASLGRLRDRLETSLPQIRGVPTVTISALKRRNLDRLMAAVTKIDRLWNTRIATGKLNRWLEAMVGDHPPPLIQGRRLRIKYMTQAKARPPTFALFTSSTDELPEAYSRYLINGLRKDFGLDGVPIRLALRKTKNPYAKGR